MTICARCNDTGVTTMREGVLPYKRIDINCPDCVDRKNKEKVASGVTAAPLKESVVDPELSAMLGDVVRKATEGVSAASGAEGTFGETVDDTHESRTASVPLAAEREYSDRDREIFKAGVAYRQLADRQKQAVINSGHEGGFRTSGKIEEIFQYKLANDIDAAMRAAGVDPQGTVSMTELLKIIRTKPPTGRWEDAIRELIAVFRWK